MCEKKRSQRLISIRRRPGQIKPRNLHGPQSENAVADPLASEREVQESQEENDREHVDESQGEFWNDFTEDDWSDVIHNHCFNAPEIKSKRKEDKITRKPTANSSEQKTDN